ncbi:MAG: type VI secretion system ATPase TssH [Desulfatitalea sp.]|nr:type VI secretion system ATPase TssH [Desulfatitalea sp.]
MANLDLKALVGKLNPVCRKAMEAAAGMCQSNTHYEVEIEHLLFKLLGDDARDIAVILKYFEIDQERVRTQLTTTISRFKTGNGRTPALSPRLPKLLSKAWLLASVNNNAGAIRSGHLLLTLLAKPYFTDALLTGVPLLEQIPVETLQGHFNEIVASSVEQRLQPGSASPTNGAGPVIAGMVGSRGGALDQYTINLTERARAGQIDPVIARDTEIRQMADILIRRRQNNPILTGEAGVGKTVVVEGFALRVVQGDVPGPLKGVEVRTLDLGLLQAGAGVKGEFENRLKEVIQEVKASPVPVILFIDEAHTMIGAGGGQGSGDAANLLKPALAKGELRTIAATTWAEYKKYFEKDAALSRRFQVIKIEEPEEPEALLMMRAIAPLFEQHHGVTITDDALVDAVRLSNRYISGRKLPDKAVSVIDTACARVAMGLDAVAPPIEATQRRIERIDSELQRLRDEARIGRDHAGRIAALETERRAAETRLVELQQRWGQEKGLVGRIRELRIGLRNASSDAPAGQLKAERRQLMDLEKQLAQLQADEPLLKVEVDAQTISEVISGWTGIPTGRMLTDEIPMVLRLEQALGKRIIGQGHALGAIARVIRTAHAGIEDPAKPTGVFMLVGPSGVGKTETALALAELLYGGEHNMVTINMSEYQEAHTVSGLKGSPPGYVGYGEGGVLTEAVRRRPYSVVLLDEIEKAHPDVTELFYQVFDKGVLEDGEGRKIDFKNTLIILTSNIGTDLIMQHCCNMPDTAPEMETLKTMLFPALQKRFKPAFLGRLQVVPYYPISDAIMRLIIRLKLDRIQARMQRNRKVAFTYAEDLVDAIAARCTEVDSGARNVDHILADTLLPELSQRILEKMATASPITTIHACMGKEGFAFDFDALSKGAGTTDEAVPGARKSKGKKKSVAGKNKMKRISREPENV